MILLDVTWGVDPRRVLFASYTSACPVCGGEHSFIHSFVPHVPTLCGAAQGPGDAEGEMQSLLSRSPQGSSKIPESWNF